MQVVLLDEDVDLPQLAEKGSPPAQVALFWPLCIAESIWAYNVWPDKRETVATAVWPTASPDQLAVRTCWLQSLQNL